MKTRIHFRGAAAPRWRAGQGEDDEDDGNKAARSPGDLELMEIAQDVDRALLREAMLQVGRQKMELPGTEDQRRLGGQG